MYTVNKSWSMAKQKVRALGFQMPRVVMLELLGEIPKNQVQQVVSDNVQCPELMQKIEYRIENLMQS